MKNTNLSNNRNLNIDLIKIVAMLGVVMLHTTHDYMTSNGWDIASFMYKSAVISIPLFFMVSGYLLLGRPDITYKYSVLKSLKIVKYVLIFCVLYWLIYSLYKQVFSFEHFYTILYESLIGQGPFFVFWYFSAIIMIYLILPVLNKIYESRYQIFLIISFILLTIQDLVFINNLILDHLEINTIFRQYNWLTYFMLGGILKKSPTLTITSISIIIFSIINYIFQTLTIPFIGTTYCSFFYSSLPIIVFVWLTFMFLLNIRLSKKNYIIKCLSNTFLLVFTIHSFFINPIYLLLKPTGYLAPILCWVLTSLISICISLLIMRIPYVAKILKI